MSSTYSALKIELIGTGEQSGTWGATTNVNLGDAALGEAITGSATIDFSTAADVTISLIDTNTTQVARNLRLNLTESGAGVGYTGNLILGSNCQIEKLYLVNNGTTATKTIKNTTDFLKICSSTLRIELLSKWFIKNILDKMEVC